MIIFFLYLASLCYVMFALREPLGDINDDPTFLLTSKNILCHGPESGESVFVFLIIDILCFS